MLQLTVLTTIALIVLIGCHPPGEGVSKEPIAAQCGWYDSHGIEFCYIAGGVFSMGDNRFPSATPPYEAKVNEFFLMKHEMTEANWAQLSNSYRPTSKLRAVPLVNVSRNDVYDALTALSSRLQIEYRLPSETEWEYAARAGTKTAYPWGDRFDFRKANFAHGGGGERAPVGSFPPNAFGLHDMIGNVAEMTSGDYSKYPIGEQPPLLGWFAFRGDGIDGGWPHVFVRGLAESHQSEPWLGFRFALDARFKDLLTRR